MTYKLMSWFSMSFFWLLATTGAHLSHCRLEGNVIILWSFNPPALFPGHLTRTLKLVCVTSFPNRPIYLAKTKGNIHCLSQHIRKSPGPPLWYKPVLPLTSYAHSIQLNSSHSSHTSINASLSTEPSQKRQLKASFASQDSPLLSRRILLTWIIAVPFLLCCWLLAATVTTLLLYPSPFFHK